MFYYFPGFPVESNFLSNVKENFSKKKKKRWKHLSKPLISPFFFLFFLTYHRNLIFFSQYFFDYFFFVRWTLMGMVLNRKLLCTNFLTVEYTIRCSSPMNCVPSFVSSHYSYGLCWIEPVKPLNYINLASAPTTKIRLHV